VAKVTAKSRFNLPPASGFWWPDRVLQDLLSASATPSGGFRYLHEADGVLIKTDAMRMAMLADVEVTGPGLGKIMEDTFHYLGFLAHKSKVTLLMQAATKVGNGKHSDSLL
jgi:hypothetical protein